MIEQEELLLNPFPGLRPFRLEENYVFFGRDGQSDQVLTKLRSARFVAVVGTSGSGKSSLVNAGLLPALFSGHMPSAGSSWRVASFRPGSSPIRNLAEALSAPGVCGVKDEAVAGEHLENIERTLRRSSLGLLEVVNQSRLAPDENLLILADQFEELFRFRKKSTAEHPADEAAAFVKLLLEAKQPDKADDKKLPIYVILTMRSDYLGDCAHFWGLPEAINEGQFLIPRMTDDNRREAITGPVIIGGGEITAPLVNRLLNDAGDDPAQLPILQHALMRTWDYWKNQGRASGPIDIPHYEKIGGMSEALSNHADEAFADLSPELQGVAVKVFKSLTEKEADNREGRRPATVAEIAAAAEARESQVKTVVEKFRRPDRSFLMPSPPDALTAGTLIDISHESLIRGWVRLRAWVDEEAESAAQYVRLAQKAALFPDAEDYLRGPALSNGLRWLEDNQPTRAWAQRYHPGFEKTIEYLELSKAKRQTDLDEAERKHTEEIERDLRHAQALAAGEQRRVRLRNWGLVILSILLLGMMGITVFAVKLKNYAEQQTVEAHTQKERAEKALKDVEVQRDNAQRSQTEAETQKTVAENALAGAKRDRDKAQRAEAEAAHQRDLAEQQRGEALTQAKLAGVATREAKNSRDALQLALTKESAARDEAVRLAKAAEAAKTEAETQRDSARKFLETIHEIDRSAPYFGAVIRGPRQPIYRAWMSARGKVITQTVDNSTEMWDPQTDQADLVNQPYLANPLTTPALYSKSGKLVLLTNYAGLPGAVAWDLAGEKELFRTEWNDIDAQTTIVSPDDRVIVRAHKDAEIFDARTGQKLRDLDPSRWALPNLTTSKVSSDGRLLAGFNSNSAEVWNLDNGSFVASLNGHLDEIKSIAFSPDSKFIVTSGKDGTARVWDSRTGDPLARLSGHAGAVNSAAFSENGRYIVTTSEKQAYLWEAKSPEWTAVTENSPTTLDGHTDTVTNATFSPDGKWVVTISQDRTAQLWDAAINGRVNAGSSQPGSAASVAVFRGHIKPVTSLDVSPDSNYVVTGSEDRTARLWDLRSLGAFNVSSVQLAAQPEQYEGKCPATVKFTGAITVQGRSGTVEYKFVRNDGSESLPQALVFEGPGTRLVSDSTYVLENGVSRAGRPYPTEGWVEIQILKPIEMESRRATFSVKCSEAGLTPPVAQLTSAQLRQIMPGATEEQLALYLPHLQEAMDKFGINTPMRRAAFLAEIAFNTAELRYLTELGSDERLEKQYGTRKDLGNLEPGDGARFKGRGGFGLQGRANYRTYSELLGIDLVAQPALAASPEVAFRTAALFWQRSGLNDLADESDLASIVRRISGGARDLTQHAVYFGRARAALGVK
jgi:WD40 repeat protein/predicted chitinase/energy-coupling factor transporter ATP-binding protein EcfA2